MLYVYMIFYQDLRKESGKWMFPFLLKHIIIDA